MQDEEEEEEEVDIEAVDGDGEESEGADFGSMPTEEQLPGMQKSKPDKYAKLSQLWAPVRLLLRLKLHMFIAGIHFICWGQTCTAWEQGRQLEAALLVSKVL